mgnify:CR=1 FL=1
MKKLFGEANINVENFNEAERKQKIKVKYYKLTASEVKEAYNIKERKEKIWNCISKRRK